MREIAEALPISRPAVSRHLRLLKDGRVSSSRSRAAPGGSTGCRRRGSTRSSAYLEQVWGEAAARFRLVAENTEAER